MADAPLRGPWLTRRALLAAAAAAAFTATAASTAFAAPRPEPGQWRPSHPPKREPRIDMVCRTCGGNTVTRDAWAEWDAVAQDWVLGAAFDYAYCHDCDEETQLEEVELDERAEVPADLAAAPARR